MKRLLVLSLFVLLFALAGCGNTDVKTGGTSNSTEKKTETTTKPAPKDDGSKTINAATQSANVAGMQVVLLTLLNDRKLTKWIVLSLTEILTKRKREAAVFPASHGSTKYQLYRSRLVLNIISCRFGRR